MIIKSYSLATTSAQKLADLFLRAMPEMNHPLDWRAVDQILKRDQLSYWEILVLNHCVAYLPPLFRAQGNQILKAGELHRHASIKNKLPPQKLWPELWAEYQKVAGSMGRLKSFVSDLGGLNHPLLEAAVETHFEADLFSSVSAITYLKLATRARQMGLPNLAPFLEDIPSPIPANVSFRLQHDGKNIDAMWSLIEDVIERGRDPLLTVECFLLAATMIYDDLPFKKEQLLPLIFRGLKSYEPTVVLTSWDTLFHLDSERAKLISKSSFSQISSHKSTCLTQSPAFNVRKYLFGSQFQIVARKDLMKEIQEGAALEKGSLKISQIQPIHSLPDYHPEPIRRAPAMQQRFQKLQKIVSKTDLDRDSIFETYFRGEYPEVLKMGHDLFYCLDGQDSIAALIMAAAEGVIPFEWLNQPIRVKMFHYNGPKPQDLLERVLTFGVSLTWKDLFPGSVQLPDSIAGEIKSAPSSQVPVGALLTKSG